MRRVLSVGELTATLRTLVESEFHEVWVEGELSGARVWNTGHMYFTLKDGQSQVRCAMFRRAAGLLDFRPADGQQVELRGRITVYESRGELQCVVEHLQRLGDGSLYELFLKLRARLAAAGLSEVTAVPGAGSGRWSETRSTAE